MRSRMKASVSAFWCMLARLVKGKADRLRASRMRLEMTMSDSGPDPRSHSPLCCVRLSRFIRAFLFPNQVPQPRCLFIVFRIHGSSQLLPQIHQLGLATGMLRRPRGDLAHMAVGTV